MVSFGGQKKAWATPRSVSFRGFIENFRRASPPPSYAEFPPPPGSGYTKPIYKTRYGAFWLLNFVTFASHSDTVLSRYNVGVNKVSLIQYTHEYSKGQREMTTLWLSHLCYDSKFWLNLLVQRCSYDSDCVCDSDSVVCANYIRTKKGLKLN